MSAPSAEERQSLRDAAGDMPPGVADLVLDTLAALTATERERDEARDLARRLGWAKTWCHSGDREHPGRLLCGPLGTLWNRLLIRARQGRGTRLTVDECAEVARCYWFTSAHLLEMRPRIPALVAAVDVLHELQEWKRGDGDARDRLQAAAEDLVRALEVDDCPEQLPAVDECYGDFTFSPPPPKIERERDEARFAAEQAEAQVRAVRTQAESVVSEVILQARCGTYDRDLRAVEATILDELRAAFPGGPQHEEEP